MRVAMAVLADAGNVREGLVNVLSAGITRFMMPAFPAPVQAVVAVLLEVDESECHNAIPFSLKFIDHGTDSDTRVVSEIGGELRASGSTDDLGIYAPIVVRLDGLEMQRPGLYSIDVRVAELEPIELRFRSEVGLPPENPT